METAVKVIGVPVRRWYASDGDQHWKPMANGDLLGPYRQASGSAFFAVAYGRSTVWPSARLARA